MTIHSNDPSVVELARLAFPEYNGRKFRVEPVSYPVSLNSHWSGGSRDFHVVVNLETKSVVEVPQNGSPFEGELANTKFPCPGVAVITHTLFQGKDLGIIIYVHPDNMNQLLLEDKPELSKDELIVLYSTAHLKSSYQGNSNVRFTQARMHTQITLERWNTALESMIAKKFLNRNKAINNQGRNALTQYDINSFHQLGKIVYEKV